jgi:hypothetical protein
MNVSIERGSSPTMTFVTVGSLELAFSYTTIIAFRAGAGPWVKSENVWSRTTGKHLNEVPGERIAHADFQAKLAALLDSIALVTS